MSGDRLADPGAQLERTSLAWTRTSISAAACGALLVRAGVQDGLPAVLGFGIVVLVSAAAVWLWSSLRYTLSAGKPERHLLAKYRVTVVGLAALAGVVSAVALLTAVLARLPS